MKQDDELEEIARQAFMFKNDLAKTIQNATVVQQSMLAFWFGIKQTLSSEESSRACGFYFKLVSDNLLLQTKGGIPELSVTLAN